MIDGYSIYVALSPRVIWSARVYRDVDDQFIYAGESEHLRVLFEEASAVITDDLDERAAA